MYRIARRALPPLSGGRLRVAAHWSLWQDGVSFGEAGFAAEPEHGINKIVKIGKTVKMQIRIWGARGACPTADRDKLRYGGNTPCVEVRTAAGGLFVIDCGTGFRGLGHALEKEFKKKPIQAHVFLSHYHWDHIQGIPFFTPLYNPSNRVVFHGYAFQAASMRAALEGQMTDPYFPVDMSIMAAQRHFVALEASDTVRLDDLTLHAKPLYHPQGCQGFRLECGGKVLAYASDTEPGDAAADRNVRELADGADVFIYDAQFLPSEMKRLRGWGHSSWKEGVRIAKECGAKRLVLFHHDPERTDDEMDEMVEAASDKFDSVTAASEGQKLKL